MNYDELEKAYLTIQDFTAYVFDIAKPLNQESILPALCDMRAEIEKRMEAARHERL